MATVKKKKRKVVNKARILAMLCVFCVIIIGAALFILLNPMSLSEDAMSKLMETGVIREGVTINGVDVGGMTYAQAKAAIKPTIEAELRKVVFRFNVDGEEFGFDADNLKIITDEEDILKEALLVGRVGSLIEQGAISNKLKEEGIHLFTKYEIDAASLRAATENAVAKMRIPVTEPGVKVITEGENKPEITEGKDGRDIDFDAVFAEVSAMAAKKQYSEIKVQGIVTKPTRTVADVEYSIKNHVSAETSFKSTNGSIPERVFNIVKCAAAINGYVIMPGEEFSMNEVVGPRTEELGWKLAFGIEDGEFTLQAGGGVCQVSTTLFIAAMKADLKITERRRHSIPISYVKKGMDATISTGGPDLKIMNDKQHPVYIFATVNEKEKWIRIDIYSEPLADGIDEIKIDAAVISEEEPPEPKITVDKKNMAPGTRFIKKEARKGYRTETYKLYYKDGKLVKKVTAYKDYYRPVQGEFIDGEPLPGSLPGAEPVIVESPGMTIKPTPTPTPTPDPTWWVPGGDDDDDNGNGNGNGRGGH